VRQPRRLTDLCQRRYEAHVRLGLPTILARVRRATREVLKMHMM
jgi:uncharacterized ParB-like nuclease family protein